MCDYKQVEYGCGHLRYVVKAWCTNYPETQRRCPLNVVAMFVFYFYVLCLLTEYLANIDLTKNVVIAELLPPANIPDSHPRMLWTEEESRELARAVEKGVFDAWKFGRSERGMFGALAICFSNSVQSEAEKAINQYLIRKERTNTGLVRCFGQVVSWLAEKKELYAE